MHNLDEIIIYCPYCGEALDVLVDTSAGPHEDDAGERVIDVKREDE
jgi:hypothetical protein